MNLTDEAHPELAMKLSQLSGTVIEDLLKQSFAPDAIGVTLFVHLRYACCWLHYLHCGIPNVAA